MAGTLILSMALMLQGAPERYERVPLPPSLRTVAVEAGLEPDALSVDPTSGEDGLLDRSDDAIVRLSKTALTDTECGGANGTPCARSVLSGAGTPISTLEQERACPLRFGSQPYR